MFRFPDNLVDSLQYPPATGLRLLEGLEVGGTRCTTEGQTGSHRHNNQQNQYPPVNNQSTHQSLLWLVFEWERDRARERDRHRDGETGKESNRERRRETERDRTRQKDRERQIESYQQRKTDKERETVDRKP